MARRDTTISDNDKLFALIYGHDTKRSKKARDVDNASTKGLTNNFAQMWVDPSRNDWSGIDTIIRSRPPSYTKAKGLKAFNNVRDILGESGFR